jgi:hypothetical protein
LGSQSAMGQEDSDLSGPIRVLPTSAHASHRRAFRRSVSRKWAAKRLESSRLGQTLTPVLCLLNGWCFVAPSLACGEARGGSIPRSGAVTDEQRSHRLNWTQPGGRQSFSLQASLLAPYRSTSGYARRSRLAWSEKPLPQNTSRLGDTTLGLARGNSANLV